MAASGIDNLGVFYSDPLSDTLQQVDTTQNNQHEATTEIEKKFKSFLRGYHVVTQNGGVVYPYRDAIRKNYRGFGSACVIGN